MLSEETLQKMKCKMVGGATSCNGWDSAFLSLSILSSFALSAPNMLLKQFEYTWIHIAIELWM